MSKRIKTDIGSSRKNDSKVVAVRPKGRGARTAGKLAPLLEMPVEIFVEVASHLHPLDVLHLSRASRDFNRSLLSRRSRPIWRSSLSSLGVPDCPADMSEPAYVVLLFDKNVCMGCWNGTRNAPNYTLRIRVCNRCPAKTVRRGTVIYQDYVNGLTSEDDIRRANQQKNLVVFTMVPQQESIFHFYRGIEDAVYHRRLSSGYFHLPTLITVLKRYFEIMANEPSKLDEYVKQQQEKTKEVYEHSKRLQEWANRNEKLIRDTKSELSNKFYDSVREKLLDLGYTTQDFSLFKEVHGVSRFDWWTYTHQPKILSPRVWASLKPKLVALIKDARDFIDAKRKLQRQRSFETLLTRKINSLQRPPLENAEVTRNAPGALYVPIRITDNLGWSPMEEFKEASGTLEVFDTATSFPDDIWDEMVGKGIMTFIETRRNQVAEILETCLQRALEPLKRAKGPSECDLDKGVEKVNIHHAAAFFVQTESHMSSRYPEKELFGYADVVDRLGNSPQDFDNLLNSHSSDPIGLNVPKWNGSTHASKIALSVLTELGYGARIEAGSDGVNIGEGEDIDIESFPFVPMEEMKAKGKVFVCMRCPEEVRAKKNWKDFIQHIYHEDYLFRVADENHRIRSQSSKSEFPPINTHRPSGTGDPPLVIEDPTFFNLDFEIDAFVGFFSPDDSYFFDRWE